MSNFLEKIIDEPLQKFYDRMLLFLPEILTSFVVFIIGLLLAIILKVISLKILNIFKVDKSLERSGVAVLLQKWGFKSPVSSILSKFIFWTILICFSILSLYLLNIPAVDRILEKFILYLPNIFVATIILIIGYFLSNFVGRAVLIASVNAGIKISGLIGKLVKITIIILSFTMALEQLGIGRETIIIAFAVIFGGIIFALSLAFGLGGKDLAKEYLEKSFKEKEKDDNINHI